ncbi:MAG: AAA family ATPase [Candidatus Omnitrophota bacterium]|nr:MAG: AAA family ATPase [Candidatus Omnitrophota bacterium]
MKPRFIQTDNVRRLQEAAVALEKRQEGVPGLGLICGNAGLGKTKSIQWYVMHSNSIYLRAKATWTVSWMLDCICRELNILSMNRIRDKFADLQSSIKAVKCTVFIDEADYLVRDRKLLDTIRDLHDETDMPIVLVGMDEIQKKLMRHHQFWSRISQQVIYKPLTIKEIILLGSELCSLTMKDASAEQLYVNTSGNFRDIIVALSHLEKMATANKTDLITANMVDKTVREVLKRKAA